MRMSHALFGFVVVAIGLGVGCKSRHEEGVKSNLRSQWTDVAADTATTTAAAESVLREEGLLDVKASSTKVDGKVTAKKADGTKVNVVIEKKSESVSQVSVTVGTIGDASLGAEIAKKVKMEAGSAPKTTTP